MRVGTTEYYHYGFKTTADPYVGKLTYFRVYLGAIDSNSQVWNATQGEAERIGQLFKVDGPAGVFIRMNQDVAVLADREVAFAPSFYIVKLAGIIARPCLCAVEHTLRRRRFTWQASLLGNLSDTIVRPNRGGGKQKRLIREFRELAVPAFGCHSQGT